ncbi:hypothetical protein [Achromobacter marplatensis]|nr:hypothetical protein [Achromobacter marplatensis]
MPHTDNLHPLEDGEASDRLLGYGIVGAFTGLMILCALAVWAINQFSGA